MTTNQRQLYNITKHDNRSETIIQHHKTGQQIRDSYTTSQNNMTTDQRQLYNITKHDNRSETII